MKENRDVDRRQKRMARKYIWKGYGSTGGREAARYYRKAVRHLKREAKYHEKSYCGRFRRRDLETHLLYKDWAHKERQRAMAFLKKAIDCGHDLALMHTALFYMEHADILFKIDRGMSEEEYSALADNVLEWIERAYDLGFAPAAYMLSIVYRDGYHSIGADAEKSAYYFSRFEALRHENERQEALSCRLPVKKRDEPGTHQLNYGVWIQWLA